MSNTEADYLVSKLKGETEASFFELWLFELEWREKIKQASLEWKARMEKNQ